MNEVTGTYHNTVLDFLSKNPRNKLIIVSRELGDIKFINLDNELSSQLNGIKIISRFSLKAKDLINDFLNNNTKINDRIGRHLAISGIGILLEKELKLDFPSFLDQYSQNQTLFLKWDGEITDNNLYFLTKQNGLEIDISNLSHIVI